MPRFTQQMEIANTVSWDTLANENYLPSQQPDGIAKPEIRRLFVAVFEEAVQNLKGKASVAGYDGGAVKMRHKKKHQVEAWTWVHADATGYLFDFVNVCQVLGLDPDAVRTKLARYQPQEQPPTRPERQQKPKHVVTVEHEGKKYLVGRFHSRRAARQAEFLVRESAQLWEE